MREKGETEVSSEMKGLYGRDRHLGGVRKFEKCDRLSRGIWKRDKRRSMISRKEKRKAEGNEGGVEFRGRGVQEKWVTGEVYCENSVWVGW